MEHSLISCRDLAACRVIVNAEMCCGASPAGGFEETRDADRAVGTDDRLCCFDHHLHLERAGRKVKFWLDLFEDIHKCSDLFGRDYLWQCDDEIVWQLSVRRFY